MHDRTLMNRRAFAGLLASAPLAAKAGPAEWVDLFDGKTLKNWRPSENKSSWKVMDGALTADGPRSHLFYAGSVKEASFRNFELEVEVTTQPGCNSGVYFHTAYQESGFLDKGLEIQINNTALGDGGYLERKRTGSLYGLRNIYKQMAPDGKPFRVHAIVRGKTVQIRVDSQLLVDYEEPNPPVIPEGGEKMRYLDRGTIALQCHNAGSRAAFRTVRIRPLPDDLPLYTGSAPLADDVYRKIINIGRHNIPVVDYEANLRGGMTLDTLLTKSRSEGLSYGVTTSTAEMKDEADARRWLREFEDKPVFSGLAATERGWTRRISRDTAQRFDYVLADSRTWTDAQAQPSGDHQHFMDGLVDETIERLAQEPVDIYAYPTYLPAAMRQDAIELWTEARSTRLIDALVKYQVAVELNSREQLPGVTFIKRAKQAGCKFALGTGNQTKAELKRCEYGLQMVETCNLGWRDFFMPGA